MGRTEREKTAPALAISEPEFSLFPADKKKAIESIHKLNFRTTPADLAAASGISIDQASFWLNRIAGETGGKLEVAADGTVYYSFARTFTSAYLQRGAFKIALVVGAFLFQVLYWLVRVSFGVALILSLLVIAAIIIALVAVAVAAIFGDSSGGDSGFGGDGGGFSLPGDLSFLSDIFRWDYSPSCTYYPNSVPSTRRDSYARYVEARPNGNFFLECFSFLFGDGAPNSNLEEVRWSQIARVIKKNGGVVSTEQLSPFLDGDRSDSGMILSALAKFNGRPEVTRSGYIVYVFPDFLDERYAPELRDCRELPYLEESKWIFSAFPADAQIKVLLLAVLNFAGSWWLFKHIATIHLLHELAVLIDVLLTFSVVLLIIPAIRCVVLFVLNHQIEKRNKRRESAYWLLRSRDADVLQEIEEAKQIRREERAQVIANREIIYSSDRDNLEQQFEE